MPSGPQIFLPISPSSGPQLRSSPCSLKLPGTEKTPKRGELCVSKLGEESNLGKASPWKEVGRGAGSPLL